MTKSDLHTNLREIAARLFSGHAAVMVGSGVSKQAVPIAAATKQFPSWHELADIFYEHAYGRKPENGDRYLDPLKLAEQVEVHFGRPRLNEILRRSIPDRQYNPSDIHKKILELPWSDVFTTNYDTLLERASESVVSRRYDIVVKNEDLVYSTRPRIVKLHGSFPAHTPFIITEEDYRTYPKRYAPFVNTVRQSLLENTICLMGFSGSDPNFVKWIGWIRDNLGHDSPKIYFIHISNISDSERTLMERRGIVTLNLSSETQENVKTTEEILEWFIEQIQSKNDRQRILKWPEVSTMPKLNQGNGDTSELLEISDYWRTQRLSFPGWIIVPNDKRTILWNETSSCFNRLQSLRRLPLLDCLKFLFEFVWRMEKCLCPLPSEQVSDIEGLLRRSRTTAEVGKTNSGRQPHNRDQGEMRHYLMLALLRNYRENGDTEKWENICNQLSGLPMSSDNMARLYYERCLYALFSQDAEGLRRCLTEWQVQSAAPFWKAKKAAILAEAGGITEALRLLQTALAAIRQSLNLSPAGTDYTLLSQESIMMLLIRNLEILVGVASGNQPSMPNEFTDRAHELKAYNCDLSGELALLLSSLEGPATSEVGTISKLGFDIGSTTTTYKWERANQPLMDALHFLRFCEDAAIPFRMTHLNIEVDSVKKAALKIFHYYPFWAIASLIRTGSSDAVGVYFSRSKLATMSASQVDLLVEHYVSSLSKYEQAGGDTTGQSYGHTLAQAIPEVLSRLCCKCSPDARRRILLFLLAIYRGQGKGSYKGIKELFRRLLQAMSDTEIRSSLNILLSFPILSDLRFSMSNEFVNPFLLILEGRKYRLLEGYVELEEINIQGYLESLASKKETERQWAIMTLYCLHLAGLLNVDASDKFATGLWSQVDEVGLPKSTMLYANAFLELPHPEGIDVIRLFKKWINQTEFPVVGNSGSYSLTGGRIRICTALTNSRELVDWREDEIDRIFERLVSWWDSDKVHLLPLEQDEVIPGPSKGREFRKRFLAWRNVMAKVVLPRLGGEKAYILRRLVAECSSNNIPVLYIMAAGLDLVPEWRDDILRGIRLQLDSPDADYRTDSLLALISLCDRLGSEQPEPSLLECVLCLAHLVRFGEGDALRSALDVLVVLFKRHGGMISSQVEEIVLERLDRLHAPHRKVVNEEKFLRELDIRKNAVKLARVLFDRHTAEKTETSEVLLKWRRLCQSSDEFAEIRNAWEFEA